MDDQKQQLHDLLVKERLTPLDLKDGLVSAYVMISRYNQDQGHPEIGLNQQGSGLLGHINGTMGALFWERGYDFDQPTTEQLYEMKDAVDDLVQLQDMPESLQAMFNDIHQALIKKAEGKTFSLLPATKSFLDLEDMADQPDQLTSTPDQTTDSDEEDDSFFTLSDLDLSPESDHSSNPSMSDVSLPTVDEPSIASVDQDSPLQTETDRQPETDASNSQDDRPEINLPTVDLPAGETTDHVAFPIEEEGMDERADVAAASEAEVRPNTVAGEELTEEASSSDAQAPIDDMSAAEAAISQPVWEIALPTKEEAVAEQAESNTQLEETPSQSMGPDDDMTEDAPLPEAQEPAEELTTANANKPIWEVALPTREEVLDESAEVSAALDEVDSSTRVSDEEITIEASASDMEKPPDEVSTEDVADSQPVWEVALPTKEETMVEYNEPEAQPEEVTSPSVSADDDMPEEIPLPEAQDTTEAPPADASKNESVWEVALPTEEGTTAAENVGDELSDEEALPPIDQPPAVDDTDQSAAEQPEIMANNKEQESDQASAGTNNIIDFNAPPSEAETEATVIEETETTVEIIENVENKPSKKVKKKKTTKKKAVKESQEEPPKKKRGRKKKILTPEEEEAKKKRRRGRKKTVLKIDLAKIEVPDDYMAEEDESNDNQSSPDTFGEPQPLSASEELSATLPHDSELDQLLASADQQPVVEKMPSATTDNELDKLAQSFDESPPTFESHDHTGDETETIGQDAGSIQDENQPEDTAAAAEGVDQVSVSDEAWSNEIESDFSQSMPPKDDDQFQMQPDALSDETQENETIPLAVDQNDSLEAEIISDAVDTQVPPSLMYDELTASTGDKTSNEAEAQMSTTTVDQLDDENDQLSSLDNVWPPSDQESDSLGAPTSLEGSAEPESDEIESPPPPMVATDHVTEVVNELNRDAEAVSPDIATFEDFEKAFSSPPSEEENAPAGQLPAGQLSDDQELDTTSSSVAAPDEYAPPQVNNDVLALNQKETTTSFDEIQEVFNDLPPATITDDRDQDVSPPERGVLDAFTNEEQLTDLERDADDQNEDQSTSPETVMASANLAASSTEKDDQDSLRKINTEKDEAESEFSLEKLTSQEEANLEKEVASDPSIFDEFNKEESSVDIGLEFSQDQALEPESIVDPAPEDGGGASSQPTNDELPGKVESSAASDDEGLQQTLDDDSFNVESPISEVNTEQHHTQATDTKLDTPAVHTGATTDELGSATWEDDEQLSEEEDEPLTKKIMRVAIGSLLGLIVGGGLSFYWFGIHQNNQLALQIESLSEKVKESNEALSEANMMAENLKIELSEAKNVLSTEPPLEPNYYKVDRGIILYWKDKAPLRRYHVYRAKGTSGTMKKVTGNPIEKNVIRFRRISRGIWRFAVTAVNEDGQETEKSEVLQLRFPLD